MLGYIQKSERAQVGAEQRQVGRQSRLALIDTNTGSPWGLARLVGEVARFLALFIELRHSDGEILLAYFRLTDSATQNKMEG